VEAPDRTRLTGGAPPAARAAARASAYRLFARLFRRAVTVDLLPTLTAIPGLGEELPHPFDADEAAAEHHRLFALQVPPWAGVFQDPEGRIGGACAALVRELYAQAGLEPDERSEEADHVAHTLDLLAECVDRPRLAAAALDRALLPWLPWLVEAIERHAGAFYRALAGLTLDLALDQRAELGGVRPPAPLPPVEDPLDDPGAGLARVARYLVTPARSGLYLSRDDVRRIAAANELPTGFGGRADSLETLLRSAADLGGFDALVAGLLELLEQGRAACAVAEGAAHGVLVEVAALRRARLDQTSQVLMRLRDASRAPA
jgi:TorA maturation chaperone TorD